MDVGARTKRQRWKQNCNTKSKFKQKQSKATSNAAMLQSTAKHIQNIAFLTPQTATMLKSTTKSCSALKAMQCNTTEHHQAALQTSAKLQSSTKLHSHQEVQSTIAACSDQGCRMPLAQPSGEFPPASACKQHSPERVREPRATSALTASAESAPTSLRPDARSEMRACRSIQIDAGRC